VFVPGVRSGFESRHLEVGLAPLAMQVVAEERRFDVLAKLQRGLVPPEGNLPQMTALRPLPAAVVPRSYNHEVHVVGIVFFRVAPDLPWPPRVFLVPESG